MGNERRAGLLQLPAEVWALIADLCQSRRLSLVCAFARRHLGGRHVAIACPAPRLPAALRWLWAHRPRLHSLSVNCSGRPSSTSKCRASPLSRSGDSAALALLSLRDFPLLQTLLIDLSWANVTSHGAKALAQLRRVPLLRHFSVTLTGSDLGSDGCFAFSKLKDAPGLRSLRLGLGMCQAGPAGGRLLAALAAAPALEALAVDLSHNRLRDSGLAALADLRHSNTLRSLSVDLKNCLLSSAAMWHLAALRHSRTLQALHLALGWNDIRDAGCCVLADLQHSATLLELHLELVHNGITAAALDSLTRLSPHSKSRRKVTVDLSFNPLGPAALTSVAALHGVCCTFAGGCSHAA